MLQKTIRSLKGLAVIVTLTGASGVGKSTIGEWLRKLFGIKLKPLESVTTRDRRDNDPPGEYIHVSIDRFEEMGQRGEFIWRVCPFGTDHYGTMFRSLEETKLEPNNVFLMILEPDSVGTLHFFSKKMNLDILSFYILSPPGQEIRRRLENRATEERLKKASEMREEVKLDSEIREWLRGQEKKDQRIIEGRIQSCLQWDIGAQKSRIPYVFIANDLNDNGQKAASTISLEIESRLSA